VEGANPKRGGGTEPVRMVGAQNLFESKRDVLGQVVHDEEVDVRMEWREAGSPNHHDDKVDSDQ